MRWSCSHILCKLLCDEWFSANRRCSSRMVSWLRSSPHRNALIESGADFSSKELLNVSSTRSTGIDALHFLTFSTMEAIFFGNPATGVEALSYAVASGKPHTDAQESIIWYWRNTLTTWEVWAGFPFGIWRDENPMWRKWKWGSRWKFVS